MSNAGVFKTNIKLSRREQGRLRHLVASAGILGKYVTLTMAVNRSVWENDEKGDSLSTSTPRRHDTALQEPQQQFREQPK